MVRTLLFAARAAGFTLLELITVLALLGVLTAIAVPQYKAAIILTKEGVLRQDLFLFRDTIDQYYVDKGKYPASLDALVEEGYLRKIPVDPVTQDTDWVAVMQEPDPDRPGEVPGVFDVKSASAESSLAGTPYSEW
jgi:general secretion pathway protein G